MSAKSKKSKATKKTQAVEAEVVQKLEEVRKETSKNMRPVRLPAKATFRPMAGFWLLHFAAFMIMIFALKAKDYDTTLERMFWGFIAFNLSLGLIRHWPAVAALLRRKGVGGKDA